MSADHYFDLENPRHAAALTQPQLALEDLTGLIVIDEVQRSPELFPLLRYLVDEKKDRKFVILGSGGAWGQIFILDLRLFYSTGLLFPPITSSTFLE